MFFFNLNYSYELLLIYVSDIANCTGDDAASKIKVDDSEFPARHGTEILFTCPRKHTRQNVNIKAYCQDGKITFFPGEKSTCTKIGNVIIKFKKKLLKYRKVGIVSS